MALVATLPEPAFAAILAVGATCNGLSETAHEPGKIAETAANDAQSDGVGKQALALRLDYTALCIRGRKKPDPAGGDIFIAPLCHGRWGELHNDVEMVAHDGVGMDCNGETAAEEVKSLDEPVFSMFEGPACIVVDTAEKSAPYTTLHPMVAAVTARRNELGSRDGHGVSLTH
ncbi:MAG: hypothetical protein AMXMBFR59_37500 [Rhodanobacteraceae bacterium]